MLDFLEHLAARWISRWAEPHADAIDAVRDLTPAVVVTGGSDGIGRALAHEFAGRAEAVVLIARTQSRLEEAARAIREKHPAARIDTLCLDVTIPEAADTLHTFLADHRLYCDVLVNNAAVGQSGPFTASNPAKLDLLLSTNMAAPARLTRAVLPAMLTRGRGGILNVSSLGALIPGPHQAAYYASKAFLLSFTEAIAAECTGRGVRIAVVLPGPVETRFHARMDAEGALYRHIIASAERERVAAIAVRGFRLGRRVIAPGVVPTLAIPFLRIMPHTVSVPVIRWLLDTGRPHLPAKQKDSPPHF